MNSGACDSASSRDSARVPESESGRCSSAVGASEEVNGALGATQEVVIFTTGPSNESCQVKCRACPEVQPDSGDARSPDGPFPERRSVSIQPTRCLTSFGRNNLRAPLWTVCVPSDRSTTKDPLFSRSRGGLPSVGSEYNLCGARPKSRRSCVVAGCQGSPASVRAWRKRQRHGRRHCQVVQHDEGIRVHRS